MGFFKIETSGTRAEARVSDSASGKTGCDACPLKADWPRLKSPRMPPSGNLESGDILVLGEAPGQDEDRQNMQFVGRSGRFLDDHIPKQFDDRLVFQNAVRCRPENNRAPTLREMHACSPYLEEDVAKLKIKAILGVGNAPLQKFFPDARIGKIHGLKFPVKLGSRHVWFYPVHHPAFLLRQESEYRNGSPALPVFRADIRTFWKQVDTWEPPNVLDLHPRQVTLCRSREEAEGFLRGMHEPLAVDIETTCLRPYMRGAQILSAAFSDGTTTIAFPISHPDAINDWGLPLLLETVARRRWVAHNVAMELAWFRFFGPEHAYLNYDDTMALGRLAHDRAEMLSLEDMSVLHLGCNVKDLSKIVVTRLKEYPVNDVLRYNGLDVLATRPIYDRLISRVDKEGYRRFLDAIDSTVGMELRGLPISQEVARQFKQQWGPMRERGQREAQNYYEAREFTRVHGVPFNISSSTHIGQALTEFAKIDLPTTQSGVYSTEEKVLAPYRQSNPLVDAVLSYREATKLESTYIDPILDAPNQFVDDKIHPTFTVMFTATARLSSRYPNIQNVPRRKHGEIRRIVMPPSGHIFLAYDYGQLEVRVLAMASKDPRLIEAIIQRTDMHVYWRDKLLVLYPDYRHHAAQRAGEDADKIPEKKLMKIMRDTVKNEFVFASFYGSTPPSCSKRMGVPLDIMEELANQFWGEFQGVDAWIKDRRREYEKTGDSYTLTGRRRHGIMSGNEPINNPIQGTAADIVTAAMNELTQYSREIGNDYFHPRINIHDDLVFIIPETDEIYTYINTIREKMVKVRWPWQIVPLMVEGRAGDNWHALEEFDDGYLGDYVR